MSEQLKSTALKRQQSKLKYAKWALQIGVWLIFGTVAFSIVWGDLLLLAAFMIGAVASYATVVYYFETKEVSAKADAAQANLQ